MWHGEEGSGSGDGQTRSFQFLPLMKQYPSFEIIRKYSFPCKIDAASLSRPQDLERELLLIHHTLPTKQTSLFSFKK